jgi:Skp family chaperone for outer membrane proteins
MNPNFNRLPTALITTVMIKTALITTLTSTLTGCGPTGDDSLPAAIKAVAIVDLDELSSTMGRNDQMSLAIKEKETMLNVQLETERAALEQEVGNKQAELGDSPTDEQKTELQSLQLESRRKLLMAQQQAQNELLQLRTQLVSDFRAEIQPAIVHVAEERGIVLVLSKNDAMVLAFAPQINITAAVADELAQDASTDESPTETQP